MDLSEKIPKNFSCEICDYYTNASTDYNKHLSTDKHIRKESERTCSRQIPPKYTCDLCDYHTYHANDCRKHLTTNKHISKTKLPEKSQTNPSWPYFT